MPGDAAAYHHHRADLAVPWRILYLLLLVIGHNLLLKEVP